MGGTSVVSAGKYLHAWAEDSSSMYLGGESLK